jgi:Holliday junction resolvase-like predicted endonuclease
MSNWSLASHISSHFERPRLGDIRPPALWPSEASAVVNSVLNEPSVTGACRRATFFRFAITNYTYDPKKNSAYKSLVEKLNVSKLPTDRYMQWIWAAGNLFEDFIVEQAKESGVFIEAQTQVIIPSVNLVGKLDLIVIDPNNETLNGIEIKSVYGHQAKDVLGSTTSKKTGKLGKPRDSNLMQAALYEWHLKKSIKDFKQRLFYGARDTGVFSEYLVETKLEGSEHKIYFKGISPIVTAIERSPITIENILDQYAYVQNAFNEFVIPAADYQLQYSSDYIQRLNEAGELSKTNKEAFEKIEDRKQENIELASSGKKTKKELKELELGDWRCANCSWRNVCYDENKKQIL